MAYMYRNGTMKFNLYIRCTALLTVYQLMYDSAIIPFAHKCTPGSQSPHSDHQICAANSVAGTFYGGCGTAMFSLLLIAGALLTVEFNRRPTKCEEVLTFVFVQILMIAYIVPNWVAAYRVTPQHEWTVNSQNQIYIPEYLVSIESYTKLLDLYQYVRFGLTGLSFLVILRMYVILLKVSTKYHRKKSPLYHLLVKLVFYPIVQIVTRLGTAPYDLIYHDFMARYPANAPLQQTIFLYFQVFLAPSGGILTFFVFLLVQTSAKTELKRMLCLDFYVEDKQPRPGAGGLSTWDEMGSAESTGEDSSSKRSTSLTYAGGLSETSNGTGQSSIYQQEQDETKQLQRLSFLDEDALLDELFAASTYRDADIHSRNSHPAMTVQKSPIKPSINHKFNLEPIHEDWIPPSTYQNSDFHSRSSFPSTSKPLSNRNTHLEANSPL